MIWIFYIVLVEQILQGVYSLWQGLQWLRMARRRLGTSSGFYRPRVALICPVKGLEPGLEQNLLALTQFDYLQYEIFFPIVSEQDPAHPVLKRVAASSKRPVHIVCAGRVADCGEKVNNLDVAVQQAGDAFEVLAFADSDGRPDHRWLARLVAPLANQNLGATTTFRWLLPSDGALWSALMSAWNAPIATFLGEHDKNFCWGGGTAIRRDRFDEVRVRDAWQGAVSDDFALTRAVRSAGYPIVFVPECLVPSPNQASLRGLFEFTTRQTIITRVYAPKLWLTAGVAHLLYCTAVTLGLILWFEGLTVGVSSSFHFLILATIPAVLCAVRGLQRLAAVVEILPEWRQKLLKDSWIWTLLAPLVPFIALYSTVIALFTRKITWRGRRYELISPTQTRVLSS